MSRQADPYAKLTKQEVINRITTILQSGGLAVSTGSTEPKRLMEAIVERFGLRLDLRLSKPELAQAIATSAGIPWDERCDSRHTPSGGGSTVTLTGLRRLLAAVELLASPKLTPR